MQPDFKKAVYWTQRSIDEGEIPDAYNLMGDFYFRGHGVDKDISKAKAMWTKVFATPVALACVCVTNDTTNA